MESSLVVVLLQESHIALLPRPSRFGILHILPHTLLLRHSPPSLDFVPLLVPLGLGLLLPQKPRQLAGSPFLEFRSGVETIRVVNVGLEVGGFLCINQRGEARSRSVGQFPRTLCQFTADCLPGELLAVNLALLSLLFFSFRSLLCHLGRLLLRHAPLVPKDVSTNSAQNQQSLTFL